MIKTYINDIRKSIENECYYSALSLALMLPDMCGLAEYPNKDVSERYIKWCDSYLFPKLYDSDCQKGLSGEALYNLRNVYFHQGSLQIDVKKVKNNENRIDRFVLMIGDRYYLPEFILNLYDESGKSIHRVEFVNARFLCISICECVDDYYEHNKDKFSFDCIVVDCNEPFPQYERKGKLINDLSDDEIVEKINNDPEYQSLLREYIESIDFDPKDLVKNVDKLDNNIIETDVKKKKTEKIKNHSTLSKRESQVRSFFGQHFRKQFYKENKEKIIKAVLESKTKQEVNSKLNKCFSSKEAGEIYKKLMPLIKDMPGK